MAKINSITKEQEALIPSYVDKWVEYASSPVDFLVADQAIEEIYKLMGKKKPTVLIATGPINAFWTAVAVQLVCGDKKAIKEIKETLCSTLRSTLP